MRCFLFKNQNISGDYSKKKKKKKKRHSWWDLGLSFEEIMPWASNSIRVAIPKSTKKYKRKLTKERQL